MKKRNQYQFDVITVGSATADAMFYSSAGELISTDNLTKQKLLAFEYGAKIYADKIYFTFGGGASNTAVAFSKLGLKSAVICRLGNDENGRDIIKNFKDNKVNTDLIKIDKNRATGFSVVLTINDVAREHIIFAHRGANDVLLLNHRLSTNIKSKWLHVASLPGGNWDKIMNKLITLSPNISWNPGGRQLNSLDKIKKILPKIKVFTLNRDEALEFKKLKNIKGLIKHIHDLGPKLVVITDGANGVYAYDGKKYYYQKAKKAKNADTVGVGDCFAATFSAALIYGKDVKQAMSWGVKNAGSVVAKVGAQNGLLNLKQIKK